MRFTIGGLNIIIIVINHPRRRPEDFRSVPSADPKPACLRSSVANTFPSYAGPGETLLGGSCIHGPSIVVAESVPRCYEA